MLTNWKVLQYVANRYGKYQYSFEESENKLEFAREGKIPILNLEEDTDRMQKRLSREGTPMTTFIERIIGETNFIDKYVLDKLIGISQGVCRLTKNGSAIGTGFLVSDDIILTNHHVISEPSETNDMYAEFNFELDEFLSPKKRSCFKLNAQRFYLTSSLEKNNAIPHSGLDFTFVGIENTGEEGESINDFKPILLDGKKGKIIKGESCVIIQHPNGLPKKIVLKDTAFFSETNTKIIYESDTLPGSSGSVVVALGTCEVIALHHCGLPKTDDQDRILTKNDTIATPYTPDDEIAWIGNAGIKISKIMEAVKEAKLPEQMENKRATLLKKTIEGSENLNTKTTLSSEKTSNEITPGPNKINRTDMDNNGYKDFLITANNTDVILSQIDAVLKVRYGSDFRFHLAMPATAVENKIELFILQVKTERAVHEEEKELVQIPGIVNAEADIPLAVNADSKFLYTTKVNRETESALGVADGFGEPNEAQFLSYYRDEKKSKYLVGKVESLFRKWNWEATNFDKIIGISSIDPYKEGIRIVQFDTGYSDHSKVSGGFDLFNDYNFLKENPPDDARDEMDSGILRQPGHGTRTGSLLIGNDYTTIPSNGNCGLLEKYKYKLVPFRIAKSVVLINRQRQLAEALDMAISQGFDIIYNA